MNEPIAHTLKPLEEEESEDERADEVFANTGSPSENGALQPPLYGDESNHLQNKVS
jgi:hypothetical protein